MTVRKESRRVAQAWIELASEDPEAASALDVARSQLSAGQHLQRLRRLRVVEIEGSLPGRERIEALLHGSTQFYNPHKERCRVRLALDEPTAVLSGEHVVLVIERDGARRAAAERWWKHETGEPVSVREGTAWALTFDDEKGDAHASDLALVRGRRQGLLCNPHSQECRWPEDTVPLPWLAIAADGSEPKAARRKPTSGSRSKR